MEKAPRAQMRTLPLLRKALSLILCSAANIVQFVLFCLVIKVMRREIDLF